jgi:AraC family transcriptional regulator
MMLQVGPEDQKVHRKTQALCHERKWRQFERSVDGVTEDISILRWTDLDNTCRWEEATTPADKFFIAICLRNTRLRLTRGHHAVFEGIMPAGTVYVGAPSRQLSAQFDAPFDFLHVHVSSNYCLVRGSATPRDAAGDLNDSRSTERCARRATRNSVGKSRCDRINSSPSASAKPWRRILEGLESLRTKVNALPKWWLRRVEEYVRMNFDRPLSLADLAKVAGLSRMHFAAQFRAATGYRPHEYVLHQRIEHAKSLLSDTQTPLADVALAAGFCAQSHFSTVFKRIAGKTPACAGDRWIAAPTLQRSNYWPEVQLKILRAKVTIFTCLTTLNSLSRGCCATLFSNRVIQRGYHD